MSLYARIALVLVALIVAAGFGFRTGLQVKQGQWDAAVLAGKEAQEKTLRAAADRIAQITVKNQTIIQRVERETIEKPVFRDCRSGPDAVRLLNRAAGHDTDGTDTRDVPPAADSGR